VNDTIRGFNVSDDNMHSIVQEDLAIFHGDGHIFAQYGFGAGQLDHIGSHDLAGGNMVEQDIGQFLLVFGLEQCVDSSSWEFGKDLVSGSKDS